MEEKLGIGDDGEPDIDPIAATATDHLSNPELTKLYLIERAKFRHLVDRAERISRRSGGIPSTGNRMFWGSVLFTRIVVTAKSVNRLLPDPKRGEHWDFSATGSLTRNLMELGLIYQWLCGEGVTEEVRAARFILLYLHDYGSRRRLFPEQFKDPNPVYEDLVRQFNANPYLASYDERQRRVALKGEKTPFLQDDVIAEMGLDRDNFRHIYRFFSQHTHAGPIAFYRMVDHDRGAGVETRHEKIYMLMALEAASNTLTHTISVHLTIFPDAEMRTPHLTRHQIEANVEAEQGRGSRGRSRAGRR